MSGGTPQSVMPGETPVDIQDAAKSGTISGDPQGFVKPGQTSLPVQRLAETSCGPQLVRNPDKISGDPQPVTWPDGPKNSQAADKTPAGCQTIEKPNRISTNSNPATQPEEYLSLDEVFYPSEGPADNEKNKQGDHKTCDEIHKKSEVLNIVQSFDGKLTRLECCCNANIIFLNIFYV